MPRARPSSLRAPSLALALVVVLGMVSLASRARAYHLEDSLRGATSGTAIGGAFSSEGWTVTSATDRIWWAVPRLASGSIEVTLSGVSSANLLVNDNEVLAMYEAGWGITEPIAYSPYFRQNHYKALVRIYGAAEVGREGAMKLMWGMCPSGDPGYWVDADATCGCGSFFEEPFASGPVWDGSPRRLRVEWGGGRTRLLVDGAEIVAIDWSESGIAFGPRELHVMLGSPRNDAVDSSAMPIGAVFSDLVIDGTEGAESTCPALDAGVSPDSDAGAPAPDAAAPAADAGVSPEPDASIALDAGARDAGAGRREPVEGSCACRAGTGAGSTPSPLPVSLLALLIALARRRARPRRAAASPT